MTGDQTPTDPTLAAPAGYAIASRRTFITRLAALMMAIKSKFRPIAKRSRWLNVSDRRKYEKVVAAIRRGESVQAISDKMGCSRLTIRAIRDFTKYA